MTVYEQTIQAYAAAISELNTEAFVACFAADCELNDPVGAPPAVGQEGARAFFTGFLPILASIKFVPGPIHEGGQRAAFTWTMEGEGKKGQRAAGDGIDVFEFNDEGKIVRSYGFWNAGAFVAALTA